jgi:hypothetical protein
VGLWGRRAGSAESAQSKKPCSPSLLPFPVRRRRRPRPTACTRCSPPKAPRQRQVPLLSRPELVLFRPLADLPKPGSPHHGGALAAVVERWPPNPPGEGPASSFPSIHRRIHRLQSRRPRPHHRELTVPPAVPPRSSTLAASWLGFSAVILVGRRVLVCVIANASGIEMQLPAPLMHHHVFPLFRLSFEISVPDQHETSGCTHPLRRYISS